MSALRPIRARQPDSQLAWQHLAGWAGARGQRLHSGRPSRSSRSSRRHGRYKAGLPSELSRRRDGATPPGGGSPAGAPAHLPGESPSQTAAAAPALARRSKGCRRPAPPAGGCCWCGPSMAECCRCWLRTRAPWRPGRGPGRRCQPGWPPGWATWQCRAPCRLLPALWCGMGASAPAAAGGGA